MVVHVPSCSPALGLLYKKMSNYCLKPWRYFSSAARPKVAVQYLHRQNEKKWQEKWSQELPKEQSFGLEGDEQKSYVLSMFPYPSGKLHMGHVRVYTISDCIGRFNRMKGKKVLHPIGWDSFGLPAENAAIERGIFPKDWTNQNIEQMRGQLLNLGIHFDWSQELSTCDPRYYKWTQWLFLQLYKHGLVYKKRAPVNWDPVDCTVLANEQVDANGFAWRSGAKVEQRFLNQWFIKTSDYAERLLKGLDDLDWPIKVKRMQQDWIGKSEGFYFDYKMADQDRHDGSIRVFTTRPDIIYGVTFIGLAPFHPLLDKLVLSDDIRKQIKDLINDSTNINKYKDKKGIDLHLKAIHPLTQKAIPVYVVNYVLDYGSQAIMGVPGHDKKDEEFADLIGLDSVSVLNENDSILVNSEEFSGMDSNEATQKIVEKAKDKGFGGHMTQYKLKDWLISRQRYWGAPIPVIHCDKCGIVPDNNLPVMLPEIVDFKQGSLGSLQDHKWRKANCGIKGCTGLRETDTMDTFVDSSWYYMRYPDNNNNEEVISSSLANQWLPVDIYIGGIEHANLHLLYARFISYFLYDIGMHNQPEPFRKLLSQGMVLGETYYVKQTKEYLRRDEVCKYDKQELQVKWEKMSKSKHNGVDPDSCIEQYGADVIRVFTLFKGPPEKEIQWDVKAIKGIDSWLNRVWKLVNEHIICSSEDNHTPNTDDIDKLVTVRDKAIDQVTDAFENTYKFNVAVSQLMILSNTLKSLSSSLMGSTEYHNTLLVLCKLMFPIAPHFAAQAWEELRIASDNINFQQDSNEIHKLKWPKLDVCTKDIELAVLVNGQRRTLLTVSNEVSFDGRKALAVETVGIMNDEIRKVIVSPHGKVVNILTN